MLARGMRLWFEREPGQLVRVWSQDASVGDRHYCDVLLEVPTPHGRRQIYLLTLITEQFAREQDALAFEFGEPDMLGLGIEMSQLEDPFCRPTIRWPELLDPDEIVRAVKAWWGRFWPDWDVRLEWGARGEQTHLWEGAPIADVASLIQSGITYCDVLLQCDTRLLSEVESWAQHYDAKSVREVGNFMIAIERLPVSGLSKLSQTWPDLEYIAVASPEL